MYKSPIEIIYGQMETQMEGDILRAVQKYGINVDKEELIRALQYDRNQYEKGYADGKADAMAELVRCKDCTYWDKAVVNKKGFLICPASGMEIQADDYCSYGGRRTDG